MSERNDIAPEAGTGVPAKIAAEAHAADVRREAAGANAHAARAAERVARAHGNLDLAAALAERWRKAEEEQLLAAVEIGRLVFRPGQGRRDHIAHEGDVAATADRIANLLSLGASTIRRFADAADVYDKHRDRWDAYIQQQRAAKKRPLIHELAALAKAPTTPAAYSPAAEDRKRARARRRALVDAAAALDACEADLIRLCLLLRGDPSDAFSDAIDEIDAARAKLLADPRVAELRGAFGAGGPPVSPAERERRMAEDDGNQAQIEAEGFDPNADYGSGGIDMTEEELEALKDAFDREHGLNKYAAQGPQPKAGDAPGGGA